MVIPHADRFGEPSTLDWKTVSGPSVTLNGSPELPSGTRVVAPTATTSYTLLAQGSIADTATVAAMVHQSGQIIAFEAFPPTIAQGESSLLRWRASNGSHVTLNGVFLMTREVIPHMRKHRSGRIINISINHETMKRKGFTPYGPSKAALESMSIILGMF